MEKGQPGAELGKSLFVIIWTWFLWQAGVSLLKLLQM